MWNYEGLKIEGTYLDFPVVGTVESSRVKYGGGVQHTVVLDTPLILPWHSDARERVLVDMENVTRVMSS